MATIEKKLIVDVPVSVAYNQWTQFAELPRFIDAVEEVEQREAERLHWVANFGAQRLEGDVRVIRQVPDELISWESESGPSFSGTVAFRPLDQQRTEIELRVGAATDKPGGGSTKVADAPTLNVIESGLQRFKEFIESRGMETGAWRGEIEGGKMHPVAPLTDSEDGADADQVRYGVTAHDGFEGHNKEAGSEGSSPSSAAVDPSHLDPAARPKR
jgi:hypothetical protein